MINLFDTQVGEAASTPLITTQQEQAFKVAVFMAMKHVKRMPITAEDQTLVGIITARDLVEAYGSTPYYKGLPKNSFGSIH